jgi:hypothetical protein
MSKIEIYYNNKKLENNEFLKPSETQTKPAVKFDFKYDKYLTLILYDPDAVGGNHIHWLVINISHSDINNGKIILPYKGPAPPPNSGKHRYIFEVYEHSNIINIEPMEKRVIPISSLKNLLGVTNSIYKIKFISENESGGKKKSKKTRKYKKTMKIRKNKKTMKIRKYKNKNKF